MRILVEINLNFSHFPIFIARPVFRMTDQPGKSNLSIHPFTPSEDRFSALIAATSDVIYSLNADWTIMHELDGRGFLKDTFEPRTDWQTRNIYPGDLAKLQAAIAEAINEKKMFQLEHRVLRADGSTGWTISRAVPILDDQGEIREWFGTASDITEFKRAEEALRNSRAQSDQQQRVYETITSATPDLMYVFDLQYRFTYVNRALLSMWGKTWDEAVGKGLLENGYEPWHAEMHEREIDLIVQTKQPIRGEVSFPHAELGRRVYDYILNPVLNEQGEVEAVAGTTRDVTERKQWEETLAATNEEQAASNEELSAANEELALLNEELTNARVKIEEGEAALRLAIEAANFGTWFIHSGTREFITDARLKELFGYLPDEELSIEQALAQITEEYREFVSNKLENAIYNNGDYDVTYPVIGLHDQKHRWLRAIGNLKADTSGAFSAFTGVVMDITESFLAAKQIERAEESLRMAIDAAGLGTFYINAADRIFMPSPKLKEFFGFLPDEIVPFEAAINQIHPDYRQQALDMVEGAFSSGTQFDMEYPVIGYHDGLIRWVRGMGTMQHYDGKDFFTGVLHEITERKQDEMRKNDFIGMVSHELKTPLTSLKAIVQVANMKLRNNGDQFLSGAMAKADAQIKRMSAMINGFLNISRLESGKIMIDKTGFDLKLLIEEIIEEMQLTVSSHQIELLDCAGPLEIHADRDKINSVVSNLISNAIKYSPDADNVKISCLSRPEEICISVTDTGIGIKASDSVKIFDRYYRVESNSTRTISGFGIGLYLSAEIVHRHGGRIWVESEFGQGSTFYFNLPV